MNTRLTFIKHLYKDKKKRQFSKFVCKCDKTIITQYSHYTSGHTKSCGCLNLDSLIKRSYKHGESRRFQQSAEYLTWYRIKRRCLNKNDNRYKYYGARGIKVCKRWLKNYVNFLKDMGRKPSKRHSIDRIDNDSDYKPSNCRWATPLQQAQNKSYAPAGG